MADTEKLNDVIDSLINDNDTEAQVAFHSYLQGKMQEVLADAKELDTDENEE